MARSDDHDLRILPLAEASALAARFYAEPAVLELERERVQEGLRSRSYVPGRLSPRRESGVWHFQNLLREAYLRSE